MRKQTEKGKSSIAGSFGDGLKWCVKAWRGYAVLALVSAAIGGYFVYWAEYAEKVSDRLESALPDFIDARNDWISEADSVLGSVRQLSDLQRLPLRSDVESLRAEVFDLVESLNEFPTPTGDIEQASADFRTALSGVIATLARYDASAESYTEIVVANQLASARGEDHIRAVEDYLGGSWPALRGGLL